MISWKIVAILKITFAFWNILNLLYFGLGQLGNMESSLKIYEENLFFFLLDSSKVLSRFVGYQKLETKNG